MRIFGKSTGNLKNTCYNVGFCAPVIRIPFLGRFLFGLVQTRMHLG